MEILDDLVAEEERLEDILAGLSAEQWLAESGAAGWSVADVVLHLAQTEETVVASVSGDDSGMAGTLGGDLQAGDVDAVMDQLVQAQRAAPDVVFERWRTARRAALEALRTADPQRPLRWVTGSLKPRTLATTRLAEHWAHGLDITAPSGTPYPDTARLRHIAWLGHSTLPYAFRSAGQAPREVFCELSGPDGDTLRLGPESAESRVTGSLGEFCRVGARRLPAAESGLVATGPHAATALELLRNYA